MQKVFSWRQNPEVSRFVLDHYSRVTSPELSTAIQEKFGVYLSPGSIRRHFCRCQEGATAEDVPLPEPEVRFPDKREISSDADVLELYELAMQQAERAEASFLGQTTLTVDFSKETAPIGICFWGDWQLGSQGVRMRQLLDDANTIRDTAGLFTVPMGDLIQNLNVRKHPQSLHECVLPDPRHQEECALFLLKKTRDKIIAMVSGNHEENTKVASGFTVTERWCKELEVPYIWHGAKIKIKVGQQEYKLGVRHKYKNESGINTTNAQRNMSLNLWPDADVQVLGHLHYNDLQKTPRPLGDTVYLRCGSYQRTDEYGMSLGQYRGQWGLPVVVLMPDVKRVIAFYGNDFYTALEFLEDQRRRYGNAT